MSKLSNLLKIDWFKYGVASIILAVPLYPKFPFISIPGTFVSVRLEDFLIAVVFLMWLIKVIPNIKAFLLSKVNTSILLFLAAGLVSVLSAILITKTVIPHIGLLHWLRRVEYLSAFFIGVAALKNKSNLRFYIGCLMVVIVAVFFHGVAQKHFGLPIITTQNFEYSKGLALMYRPGSHLVATFAGHYDLATFLVLVSPLVYTLLFTSYGKREKAFFVIISLISLWLLVNSISRISIVSFMGSVTLSLILIRRFKAILVFLVITIVFIGLSSNLIDRYTRILRVTVERIMYLPVNVVLAAEEVEPKFEDRSSSIRFNVEWPRALRAFTKNPLLGTGYSSITLATDSHYLRLIGEVGLIGFLAFFLIFIHIGVILLRALLRIKSMTLENVYLVGVVAALPGVFLNAVFIDVFDASKFAIIFWLMLGFAVSLAQWKEN